MPSSGAFVCSDFVPLDSNFVVKSQSQRRPSSYTNQYVFRRSDAASNRDFERGFEGPSGVGASISMFCASLHLFLPVTANYLPDGEIISLLRSCTSGTANFPQAIVIK